MTTSHFDRNSQYQLTVEGRLESQNAGNKTSVIYWEMVVTKTGNGWAWASANMGNSGRVWAYDNGVTLWDNPNLAYDFRNGNRWVFASGYQTIQHRSDGTGEYNVHGEMRLANIGWAGAGTGRRSLPRLAQTPATTTPLYIDWITSSSLRYVFAGNWDGGAPIREWQVLWQEGNGSQNGIWSNGAAFLTGLKPATWYHFWSRGRNDVGWSPLSHMMSARTQAGALVKHQGVWREAVPYVKHQGEWRLAESHIKHDGQWKRGI